jgi:triphosphoribosyl-dephospho-CoA synthase
MGTVVAPVQYTFLASLASMAMKSEVLLTPKPGLVDRADQGAHRDMNALLFTKSADAVFPFLEAMVLAAPSDGPACAVLPVIRPIGMEAEKAMFRATEGINTHKGQIFTLGICSSAAKRVFDAGDGSKSPVPQVLDEAARICSGLTEELILFRSGKSRESRTNGQSVYREHGCTGVRGEAEQGFPSVGYGSLPAFRWARERGFSEEEAALEALLCLMAIVDDSNVLHRRGLAGLSLMRVQAEGFLYAGGMEQPRAMEKLQEMNRLFIAENISPGGCADLLALTLFLIHLEDLWYEQANFPS